MMNNTTIDVVLGLVFIYLLYSLLATVIQEIIAHWFELRPRMLIKSIAVMLDKREYRGNFSIATLWIAAAKAIRNYFVVYRDRPVTQIFFEQPSIKFLGESDLSRKPSEISAETFAQTLIRMLHQNKPINPNEQILNVRDAVFLNSAVQFDAETQKLLKSFLIESGNDIEIFRKKLEEWFNETQLRVQGWYKRQTQVILLCIGFALACANNIDSIAIYKLLTHNSIARSQLTEMASVFKQQGIYERSIADANPDQKQLNAHFDSLNVWVNESQLIFGLRADDELSQKYQSNNCLVFLGWLITAMMISLGAPFWFDLLNKVMQLRGNKQEEQSKPLSRKEDGLRPPVVVNLNNDKEAVG